MEQIENPMTAKATVRSEMFCLAIKGCDYDRRNGKVIFAMIIRFFNGLLRDLDAVEHDLREKTHWHARASDCYNDDAMSRPTPSASVIPYAEPTTPPRLREIPWSNLLILSRHFSFAMVALAILLCPAPAVMSCLFHPSLEFGEIVGSFVAIGLFEAPVAFVMVLASCALRVRSSDETFRPRMIWSLPAIHIFVIFIWLILFQGTFVPRGSLSIVSKLIWWSSFCAVSVAIPWCSRFVFLQKLPPLENPKIQAG